MNELTTGYLLPDMQEDIEKELSKVSRASRGLGLAQHIMVSEKASLPLLFHLEKFDFTRFNKYMPTHFHKTLTNFHI